MVDGGRNCEFLLSLFNELKGHDNIYALAADTDGIDGVEDNAGAWITPNTWQQSEALSLKAETYLDANNSYDFFDKVDVLLTTGADTDQCKRLSSDFDTLKLTSLSFIKICEPIDWPSHPQ